MTADRIARLLGAGFGAVYVLVNAGALGSPLDVVLRVAAGLSVVALLTVLPSGGGADRRGERPPVFGRGYALVVLAEVAAVVGGSLALGALGLPGARFPWLTFVVGVHFVLLARVWRERSIGWVGGALAVCGALGFGAALAGATPAAVTVLAGVLPGVLLLGGAWWGVAPRPAVAAAR